MRAPADARPRSASDIQRPACAVSGDLRPCSVRAVQADDAEMCDARHMRKEWAMWYIIIVVLAVVVIGYVSIKQTRHPVTPGQRSYVPDGYKGWHWEP